MLRKHHKFGRGHKVRNSDVSLLLFELNNDSLNLHTNPYDISVMQQRFSLVSLGYVWAYPYVLKLGNLQIFRCISQK